MDIIKEAQDILMTGNCMPHIASEHRNKLAGQYSFLSGILGDILARKPKTWLLLRESCKSDSQADRKYEMTDDGINEIGIRLQIKAVEKMLSSFKTIIYEIKQNLKRRRNN